MNSPQAARILAAPTPSKGPEMPIRDSELAQFADDIRDIVSDRLEEETGDPGPDLSIKSTLNTICDECDDMDIDTYINVHIDWQAIADRLADMGYRKATK